MKFLQTDRRNSATNREGTMAPRSENPKSTTEGVNHRRKLPHDRPRGRSQNDGKTSTFQGLPDPTLTPTGGNQRSLDRSRRRAPLLRKIEFLRYTGASVISGPTSSKKEPGLTFLSIPQIIHIESSNDTRCYAKRWRSMSRVRRNRSPTIGRGNFEALRVPRFLRIALFGETKTFPHQGSLGNTSASRICCKCVFRLNVSRQTLPRPRVHVGQSNFISARRVARPDGRSIYFGLLSHHLFPRRITSERLMISS